MLPQLKWLRVLNKSFFFPTAKEYTINDNEAGDNKKDSDRKGLQKDNVPSRWYKEFYKRFRK